MGVDNTKLTPMLQQYYSLKEHIPHEAVLFFRMGDFYELFGEDAEWVAPHLGIVLTTRQNSDQNRIPFCGVPHHSATHYITKLLGLGKKVAIAEQITKPGQGTGILKRDIVRIHSPGCSDFDTSIHTEHASSLAAVFESYSTRRWHICICNYSTGELRIGDVDHWSQVLSYIGLFSPQELLIRRFQREQFAKEPLISSQNIILSDLPETTLKSLSSSEMTSHSSPFIQALLKALEDSVESQALLLAVFSYLKELGAIVDHFKAPAPLDDPECMQLGDSTIRDLEVITSASKTRHKHPHKGSLLAIINHTSTAMGHRLLQQRLIRPFQRQDIIEKEHDHIAYLICQPTLLHQLKEGLKGFCDLERLRARTCKGQLQATHAFQLKDALEASVRIATLLDSIDKDDTDTSKTKTYSWQQAATDLHKANTPYTLLHKALSKQDDTGSIINEGYYPQLDQAKQQLQQASNRINDYEDSLRQSTAIGSLKIRNHKTFGLLIEVTKTHQNKVPSTFRSKQTLVNATRYTTDFLEELSLEINQATENTQLLENEAYTKLTEELRSYHSLFALIAKVIAQLDVWLSHSITAINKNYSRPHIIADAKSLHIQGGFHPMVAEYCTTPGVSSTFTTNSLHLQAPQKHVLITGPNMGGKSTLMRQTALCALLCQAGSFVPAQSCQLPLFDAIYTRIGASDDLSQGKSTFMMEMSETAHILHRATQHSLIILDELGRGTSTTDGLSLAFAILEECAHNIQGWLLFATHYHELTTMAQQLPSVRLMQTEVLRQDGELIFTYRITDGVCSHSFGLETAALAGLPPQVLKRAKHHLAHSTTDASRDYSDDSSTQHHSHHSDPLPANIHTNYPKNSQNIIEELAKIDTQTLSPLQAFHILLEWKKKHHKAETTTPSDPISQPSPSHSHTSLC
ncbi:MAG: DNA mismatch repair protein MutS [Proteobacteria bacterium]|nr:DNA mismatch repair protein MutS [Pseudomonadota bacterium]